MQLIKVRLVHALSDRMKVRCDIVNLLYSNRRWQMSIERCPQTGRGQVLGVIKMRNLTDGMNTRIGTAGGFY